MSSFSQQTSMQNASNNGAPPTPTVQVSVQSNGIGGSEGRNVATSPTQQQINGTAASCRMSAKEASNGSGKSHNGSNIGAKNIKQIRHEDEEQGKLFVGGLSWDTSQDTLLRYFSRFGEVIDCVVMKNAETGRSRGFGFVTFSNPANVDAVLASCPHSLDGRTIDPKACNPRSMQKPKRTISLPKVFLGGLPSSITETELRSFFSQYGEVCEVVIMYDQEKKKSRGFGFLSFIDDASCSRAVSEHYVTLQNKKVEVKRAEPRINHHEMKEWALSSNATPTTTNGAMVTNGHSHPPSTVAALMQQPPPTLRQPPPPVGLLDQQVAVTTSNGVPPPPTLALPPTSLALMSPIVPPPPVVPSAASGGPPPPPNLSAVMPAVAATPAGTPGYWNGSSVAPPVAGIASPQAPPMPIINTTTAYPTPAAAAAVAASAFSAPPPLPTSQLSSPQSWGTAPPPQLPIPQPPYATPPPSVVSVAPPPPQPQPFWPNSQATPPPSLVAAVAPFPAGPAAPGTVGAAGSPVTSLALAYSAATAAAAAQNPAAAVSMYYASPGAPQPPVLSAASTAPPPPPMTPAKPVQFCPVTTSAEYYQVQAAAAAAAANSPAVVQAVANGPPAVFHPHQQPPPCLPPPAATQVIPTAPPGTAAAIISPSGDATTILNGGTLGPQRVAMYAQPSSQVQGYHPYRRS